MITSNTPRLIAECDDDDILTGTPTSFEDTVLQRIMHFYISEEIGDPAKYIGMIQAIKTANAQDIIYIYLNTPGGLISTGIQIINAMKSSAAQIITVLEGEVASMGTLIFLSGDQHIVNDHCLFMIHNFSGGVHGKGHEQLAMLEGTLRWYNSLARSVYIPFITQEELDDITAGNDLYLSSDDVRERLLHMYKLATAELELAEKPKTKKKRSRKQA